VSRKSTSVSPELVLVDPALAVSARERLPAPPNTLEALRVAPRAATPTNERRSRRWRSRAMTGIGVLLVLAASAFLVGSRADFARRTAAPVTATAEPQPPSVSTETSQPANESAARSSSRSSGAPTGTRRFVWPPVAGATGYHVELFNGSALILRDDVKKPEVLIRRRWQFDGRDRSLDPGEYRWYVWPQVDGQRSARAIVQAKLVIPR
jgi:hypothetical protein